MTDELTADVNYVVTLAGDTKIELVRRRVESPKDKEVKENEADPIQIKNLKKTLAALEQGRILGMQSAEVVTRLTARPRRYPMGEAR